MIYQERMRRVDDRIFTALDFPDCGQIRPQRPVSTTPLQALNLMNSDFVLEQSKLIAKLAVEDSGSRQHDAATQVGQWRNSNPFRGVRFWPVHRRADLPGRVELGHASRQFGITCSSILQPRKARLT